MVTVDVTRSDGQKTALDSSAIDELKSQLRGGLLQSGEAGFEEARKIWNAMIDRRPALIARCMGAADVIQCVNFARTHGLLLSVRGGGHNIAGNAVCDGGLMIDLSQMRSVRIDPINQRAYVEPGVTLGEFDREAQAFGLATPLGINSTTGVAGLTLGGGFGWLSRMYGMTIDNLLSADVVTADGRLLHASPTENSDLFWGIRGGGGNLGVVTSFEFQLHRMGPEVFAGLVVYPLEEAKKAFQQYREFIERMPDEMSVWAVLRKAPPLPFLPENVHGKEIAAFAVIYAGDPEQGKKLAEPIATWGTPYGQHLGPVPYTAWQQVLDPLLTPGLRNYWKSNIFSQISDGLIDTWIEYAGKLPTPQTEIALALIGAQTTRVSPQAMAWAHRDAKIMMNLHGRWENPADDQKCITWAREMAEATAPFATGGVYVNFLTQEEGGRIKAAYGPNYDRMVELKAKYDPTNLFRMNQNVQPPQSMRAAA